LDLVQAAASLIAAGGVAYLLRPWAPVFRDWLLYHHCNRVEKRAVKRGQNFNVLKLIQVAREGLQPRTDERLRPQLPRKSDDKRAA
jgi:hypothetical protein